MPSMPFSVARRIGEEMASNSIGAIDQAVAADPLAHIVNACRRGEPLAQRELVLQTQARVYRTLVRLVGAQDAEDVAQQVYLQVFRQLGQFTGESAFGTWLYRVVVNEALQHLRKMRTRRCAVLNWEPPDRAAERCRGAESRELLDRALAQIEPELRTIFVLREVDGLSYEAIGAALGIPMGTVASRLSRARHELQQRLRKLGWNS